MSATLVYLSAHANRRRSLPLRLKLQDIKAWPAGNVLDAIQLVRQHAPDLMLIDLDAPENEERAILQQLMLHVDVRSVPLVGLAPAGQQPLLEPYVELGLKYVVADDGNDSHLAQNLVDIGRERSLNRPHVFLMEDDPVLAEVLVMALQESGFRVTTTAQGSEALRLLRTATFDAIVTDIHVKEFSGFQLIEFLAQQGVRTPVMVITGAFPQGFHQLARKLNVAEYFEKPLDVAAFINRLRALIQERRRSAS
ncbi:MAG: response regulator [Pseudobdellovibrionaceae bacterium]|uniref:response regulator transcription factor n=1 Tax=Oligoflexus sp. TaxID=1971216 RepID=UPI0027C9E905|nr:response regulator [Oligoflexus sp.]MDQ3232471.1 response regulator [Pseudobdellovibrionaceae bacterium]HYX35900.1 response regulator [Oligoflexus sp.]